MTLKEFTRDYLEEFVQTLQQLDMDLIEKLYAKIDEARKNSKSIFVLGNGGSAASASHWVCDFNKGTNWGNSKRIKMYCLSDNTPIFSALANDISYETVFEEQLKNYLVAGDLVIGLSVSGNSKNVLKAIQYAKSFGADTFSIVGDFENSGMRKESAHCLVVPSKNYGIVEDIHMYICHLLSQYLFKRNQQSSE